MPYPNPPSTEKTSRIGSRPRLPIPWPWLPKKSAFFGVDVIKCRPRRHLKRPRTHAGGLAAIGNCRTTGGVPEPHGLIYGGAIRNRANQPEFSNLQFSNRR